YRVRVTMGSFRISAQLVQLCSQLFFFFFSSRRRHTRWPRDWSSDVCSSDLDDGGVAQTWDKGGNWDFLNTFPIGQPYIVSYDMAFPYNVCAGYQDNGSWCGPSRRRQGELTNADWTTVGGGDGFYTAQAPTDPNTIYVES